MMPKYSTSSRTQRKITLGDLGMETRDSITLDSGNIDAGADGDGEFRSGNVVVLNTSTGTYVEANDAAGDRCAPPVITSHEAPDADWASKTITLKKKGATVAAVVLGGGDDSTSEVVTALNASAPFRAHAVASGADLANLVITGTEGGADQELEVTCTLDTAFATDDGSTSSDSAVGTDADYKVTLELGQLEDEDGDAVEDEVQAADFGHFDESELVNLTKQAKAVLTRRGSKFE